MADIFISYKKEDEACARLLAGVLEQSDWSVFWDRNIPPGKIFTEVIHEELESAKCVLVLWSQAAIASGWVRDEAQVAADRGRAVQTGQPAIHRKGRGCPAGVADGGA